MQKSYNQFNDIAAIKYGNLTKIYEVSADVIDNIDATQFGEVKIEPGEYYYRHALKSTVSEGSCLFTVIQNDRQFPLISYYVEAPSVETNFSVIPYRFITSTITTIRFHREKPTSENFKIRSVIEIYKRVK